MKPAIGDAYEQVRAALVGLREPPPAADDLAQKLAACVADFRQASGLPADLSIADSSALALPRVTQTQALHIAREALTNVRRHAQARGAWVRVERANGEAWFTVVDQAADGLEALTLARDLRPDLIVMDIKMPVCDGLEATRLIRAGWPDARVLILTVHDEDEKLFEAIKSGASSYLLKDTHSADFLRGLRNALAGEAALPPKLAARLLDEFARLANRPAPEASPPSADSPDLTPREREVLNLIAADATDKEIAAQLSLSLHTVKTHVRNILSKLHAVNRRHAARLATQEGWVNKQET